MAYYGLTLKPNWAKPIKVGLSWDSHVTTAITNHEQRSGYRTKPRLTIAFETVDVAGSTLRKVLMAAAKIGRVAVPLWPLGQQGTAFANAAGPVSGYNGGFTFTDATLLPFFKSGGLLYNETAGAFLPVIATYTIGGVFGVVTGVTSTSGIIRPVVVGQLGDSGAVTEIETDSLGMQRVNLVVSEI